MFEYLEPPTPGDTYTTKERERLGGFKQSGLMRYKDLEACYCLSCETVYNVECPNCGLRSAKTHQAAPGDKWLFYTDRPLSTQREDGFYWTSVTCSKCDYAFMVIVR